MQTKKCRFCSTELKYTFVDLGVSPVSNAYIKPENTQAKEDFFPLHVYVCDKCFLTQIEEFETVENIFSKEYAYFSSFSDSWLEHCKKYTDKIIKRLNLSKDDNVIELASNDGYLLQYFNEKNIQVLGIEPSLSVAKVAREKGIKTICEFFGINLAKDLVNKGIKADLLIGNNVLAHVPDINDFIAGTKIILSKNGTITMEFPHLLNLIIHNQFDTIYHEHFSYLSLTSVKSIFNHHELDIYDVEEISTHGGSLRIYACHKNSKEISKNITNLLKKENDFGINNVQTYKGFSEKVKQTKRKLLELLIRLKNEGKTIVGYGAPAKGNTLLNYCGIGKDFIDYTVDRNPHKQGMLLPGSRIPIKSPDEIKNTKPEYILILPWNIKEEIIKQLEYTREWDCKFLVPIPEVTEIELQKV